MLPSGADRRDTKTFEEITIPPAPVRKIMDLEQRVPVESMSSIGQLAFRGITSLNRIQSIVFETAYRTSHNMLICAPTGAGKTNIAMLATLRCIEQVILEQHSKLIMIVILIPSIFIQWLNLLLGRNAIIG